MECSVEVAIRRDRQASVSRRFANLAQFGLDAQVNTDMAVRTLMAPPGEFAWAWGLERPASESLRVVVVPELAIDASVTRPSEHELVLWFGVPDPRGDPLFFDCLSSYEQARAASFYFAADRWAFAAAHAGLRIMLGSMLECAPRALRFGANANGKPYLDHDDPCAAVRFSISHTRDCVAVAVARAAVGIDVERRRAIPDLMAVAKSAFSPEGYAALAGLSGSAARTDLFYRYWTLGEAFVKATGEGVALDLMSFAFTEKSAPALVRVSAVWGPVERWRFHCEP